MAGRPWRPPEPDTPGASALRTGGPSCSTSTASDTLSTESRLTAHRLVTEPSPASSTTSLDSPRTVVVHSATSARRNRGMAASRERRTTGPAPGRRQLAPPHLPAGGYGRHDDPAAARKDPRSPHSSGSSRGCGRRPSRRGRSPPPDGGHEDGQRFVDQGRIGPAGANGTSGGQEVAVDGGADPDPSHAMATPHICHSESGQARRKEDVGSGGGDRRAIRRPACPARRSVPSWSGS